MGIEFKQGSRKRLNNNAENPELTERIIERLQSAVPHLIFDDWKVFKTKGSASE